MRNRLYIGLVMTLLIANVLMLVQDTLARRGDNVFSQLETLVDLRHEIVQQYVEQPDQTAMLEAAIQGMVGALGDPYTSYLSPEDLQQFDKRIRGTFSGIGAEITIDEEENRLKIVTPLEDMPAWHAGVLAGDIVLDIDGVTTLGMDVNEAVDRLTGPEGTKVLLNIRHETGKVETVTITRGQINVPSIKGLIRGTDNHWQYMIMPDAKIGYVRLTQFSGNSAADLAAVLTALQEHGLKGLILDMRFNPGGLLESAVEVADMFLPEGKEIVSVRGRVVPEQTHTATDSGPSIDVPMVVLANEASASAAEIVTGALSDHDRAKFIGTRTFGKGSVQQIRMLEGGEGAIKITNAYYYLPSGRNIHRRPDAELWGVDPQEGYYVPMTPEQIEAMQKARRDKDILRRQQPGAHAPAVSPQWVESELHDPQLAAAIRALEGKLTDDKWPIVGEKDVQHLVQLNNERNRLLTEKMIYERRMEEIEKQLEMVARGELPSEESDTAAAVTPEDVKEAIDPEADDAEPAEGAIKKPLPEVDEEASPEGSQSGASDKATPAAEPVAP